MEYKGIPEVPLEFAGIHTGCTHLHRVRNFHACLNEVGNEGADGTAAVQLDERPPTRYALDLAEQLPKNTGA